MYHHSFILSLSLYYTYNMHIRSLKYQCNILRSSSQYANGWYPAAPIQESQSRNPNQAIQIQESQSSTPNPGISIQEGCTSHQCQWGALPNPAFPIQETQSISLNPGEVRNPGGVRSPYPYNIPILSL